MFWVWCQKPKILVLGSLRKEDGQFRAILSHKVNLIPTWAQNNTSEKLVGCGGSHLGSPLASTFQYLELLYHHQAHWNIIFLFCFSSCYILQVSWPVSLCTVLLSPYPSHAGITEVCQAPLCGPSGSCSRCFYAVNYHSASPQCCTTCVIKKKHRKRPFCQLDTNSS